MNWFQKIFLHESTQWSTIRDVRRDRPLAEEEVGAGDFYVELYLESFRLQRDRVVGTSFRGVVYAYLSLPRQGDTRAEVTSISTPGGLRQATEGDLDKMISVNTRIAGPIPWQGGPMSIELGVISIKTGNLLAPFVDYVGRIASTIGVTGTAALVPFLPLVSEGLELMAGQTSDSRLAIGLDTDIAQPGPVTLAVIAAPSGTYTESSLALSVDGYLTSGEMSVRESYVVVSLRRRANNPEWANDLQLKAAWDEVKAAIVSGRRPGADEAMAAFRRTVSVSTSLTEAHKGQLVEWAAIQLLRGFPGGGIASDPPEPPADLTDAPL